MRKLEAREIWNDSVGVLLCIAGLVGVSFNVEYAGWLIFFGCLFFFG
jgi:hypothetical protein